MLRQGTAMPIMVECNSCGKQYNAPDSMAGKRVKCKQCGEVFQIPAEGGPGISVDDQLSALAALEKSYHEGEAASASVHAEVYKPPAPGYASGEGDEFPLSPKVFGRPNTRFKYPFAAEVDQYLPAMLVIGGLAAVTATAFKLDDVQK